MPFVNGGNAALPARSVPLASCARVARVTTVRRHPTNATAMMTFDEWLAYQRVDKASASAEELAGLRDSYDYVRRELEPTPRLGRMKLGPMPAGEHRYAVAIRHGADLWLTLWVRRSPKGEFFVLRPVAERPEAPPWNPHSSYHLDGRFHMKDHDRKMLRPHRLQPLGSTFRGAEHLGHYYGHDPKGVGAICDVAFFSGIVEVASGVLGPTRGGVAVELVEPGHVPPEASWFEIVTRQCFRDVVPWIVITVGRLANHAA